MERQTLKKIAAAGGGHWEEMHVDRGLMLLALCRGPHLHLPFRGGVVAVFACAHKLSFGTVN